MGLPVMAGSTARSSLGFFLDLFSPIHLAIVTEKHKFLQKNCLLPPNQRTIYDNDMGKNKTFQLSNILILLLNVILPIVLGGIIYLSWRKDSLYMFHWFKYSGLNDAILCLRETFFPLKDYLPTIVLYSLPDAVWVYSFSFFMIWLWKDGPKPELIFWGSIGAILGIGGEFGQLFGIVRGTYDFVDLLLCTISVALAISAIKILETKNAEGY